MHCYLEFITYFPQDLIRWQWKVFSFSCPCLKVLVLSSHHLLSSHLGMLSSFPHLFASIQLCSEVLVTPKTSYAPVHGTFDNPKSSGLGFFFFLLIMCWFESFAWSPHVCCKEKSCKCKLYRLKAQIAWIQRPLPALSSEHLDNVISHQWMIERVIAEAVKY